MRSCDIIIFGLNSEWSIPLFWGSLLQNFLSDGRQRRFFRLSARFSNRPIGQSTKPTSVRSHRTRYPYCFLSERSRWSSPSSRTETAAIHRFLFLQMRGIIIFAKYTSPIGVYTVDMKQTYIGPHKCSFHTNCMINIRHCKWVYTTALYLQSLSLWTIVL
jgi:hypothetical protein